MAYEERDNSGTLFKNTEKTAANPNWPDYKGDVMVAGRKFYLSAWIKEGKTSGKKFFSLSFKAKDEQQPAPKPSKAATDAESDLPF